VVSRTIDIFFSKPDAATASGSGGENGGGEASVDSRSFYSQEEDQEIV